MVKKIKNKILFLERIGEVYREISLDLIACGAAAILVRNLSEVDAALIGFDPNIIIAEAWFIQQDSSILMRWEKFFAGKRCVFIFMINRRENGKFVELLRKISLNFSYSCVYVSRKKYEKIADAVKSFLK